MISETEEIPLLAVAASIVCSLIGLLFIVYQRSDQKRIETALDEQGIPAQYADSLPFLGHVQQFWDHGRLLLEHFDRPNQAPLEYMTLFGSPLLVVTDPALSLELWQTGYTKWDKSRLFYSLMDVLFGTQEPTLITHTSISSKLWQAKREIASQSFRKTNMDKLAAFLEERVMELCEDWGQRGTGIDVDRDLTTLTLRVILYHTFGIEVSANHVQPLQEALSYMVDFAWTFNYNPLNAMRSSIPGTKAYRASQTYRNYVRDLIRQAQASDNSNNGHLIHAMLTQKWKPEILENEVMTLIFAGHDTTAHSVAIALENCIQHPAIIQSIREEYQAVNNKEMGWKAGLKWPTAAFKESLRLNPETPGGTIRVAPKDTNLGDGYVIPKGCAVMCPFWTYSRSEQNWGPDSLEFRPERFLAGNRKEGDAHCNYMPFSQGKRNCVGMPLAYMEGSMLLGYILTHLDLSIEVPLKKAFKITVRVEDFVIGAKPSGIQ